MRIFLVSEEFPEETNYGGIGTYHYTLSGKLVNLGHNVTILCKSLNEECRYINHLGVNVIRLRPFFGWNNLFLYRIKVLFALISEQIISKIDVIESPEWNGEIFFYSFINFIWKTKIILRLHTPLFVCKYLNNLENSISNTISIYIEKYLIKNTKYITCCSHSLLGEMRKTFKINNNIKVIHNPGNDFLFDIKNSYEDLFHIESKNINILFAGSHEYRKGIDIFAKAMNSILNKYDNVNIIFAGKYGISGNSNKKLSINEIYAFFDKKNYDKIRFLGKIDYEKMPNLYKYCDICIYPSIYDNYPGVVVESLLMKKAVIVSKNTGIIENITHGVIYIDPTNITELIKNTELLITHGDVRLKLGNDGYDTVTKNNPIIINNIINFYVQ